MCFIIKSSFPKPKIATTDIIAFKAFNCRNVGAKRFSDISTVRSPYRSKRYQLGKHYKDNRSQLRGSSFVGRTIIHKAFHSHSIFSKCFDHVCGFDSDVICKVIIPKGSLYLYNWEYKEYVSDQIIVDEVLYFGGNLTDEPNGIVFSSSKNWRAHNPDPR